MLEEDLTEEDRKNLYRSNQERIRGETSWLKICAAIGFEHKRVEPSSDEEVSAIQAKFGIEISSELRSI